MEEQDDYKKSKGGRPCKTEKRNIMIGVKCTLSEKIILENKAQSLHITLSEFLRSIGLNSKIDRHKKQIPLEVLEAIANLNHMASNLNQIAKKRNSFDELTSVDRLHLEVAVELIRRFVNDFKNSFK